MSITSIMVNYLFNQGDKKRDKGLQTPLDIERKDNLSYGPYGKSNLLDVYYLKENAGKLPVIVNVHGGGWVYGTKEVYQFYCMSLAQRGFAVVNFNYRLAPARKFHLIWIASFSSGILQARISQPCIVVFVQIQSMRGCLRSSRLRVLYSKLWR